MTTRSYDNLFVDTRDIVEDYGTLAASQTLTRGCVLGKITVAAGTPVNTGTGDGAATWALSATGGPAKIGNYLATCVAAASNAGTFHLYDPEGVFVGVVTVAATAFVGGGVSLSIADDTDFIVGDYITLPITAGSGQLVACDIALTNGAKVPWGVLLADCTVASGATAGAPVARTGRFNSGELTFGGSTVVANVLTAMEARMMFPVTVSEEL
jgi:hypothetical protein